MLCTVCLANTLDCESSYNRKGLESLKDSVNFSQLDMHGTLNSGAFRTVHIGMVSRLKARCSPANSWHKC